jgi:hypothetical protein
MPLHVCACCSATALGTRNQRRSALHAPKLLGSTNAASGGPAPMIWREDPRSVHECSCGARSRRGAEAGLLDSGQRRSFRPEMPKLAPGVLRPWSQPFRQVPPEMKAVQASPQQGLKNTCETQAMRMAGSKQRLRANWVPTLPLEKSAAAVRAPSDHLAGRHSYTHLIEGVCTPRGTMFSQVRRPTVVARGNDNALSAPLGKESPVITHLRERPGY